MLDSEVTIIIHGPLTIYTIFSLYRFKNEHKIILVIPKPTNKVAVRLFSEIQNIIGEPDSSISLVVYDDIVKPEFNNAGNRYYHFYSVDKALSMCNTSYVIKIRSDEFYSNLSNMIRHIRRYPKKIVTGDVFFRRQKTYTMHPSDHLMGGKTELMTKVFTIAKKFCESPMETNPNRFIKFALDKCRNKNNPFIAPEQYIGCAVLTALNENDTPIDDKKLMGEAFHIVRNSELGVTKVAFNSAGKDTPSEYFDDSYLNMETDIVDISEYGEPYDNGK